MERKGILPVAGLLLAIGAVTLSRFAAHVKSVDAVGLSGGGFAIGVAFVLVVFGFTGRLKA